MTQSDDMRRDCLAQIAPLSGWQEIPVPQGRAFAPAMDVLERGSDFDNLPLTFLVAIVPTASDSAVGAPIVELMGRRVRQGDPEWFSDTVGGLASVACSWADGVTELLSWFVIHPSSSIIELQMGRWNDRPATPSLASIAKELLRRVSWR